MNELDQVRAGSLADEGGASAAATEAQAVEAEAREYARPVPRSRRKTAESPETTSMLFELSIVPLGDIHMSDELAEVLEVIEQSGLPYQLTPGSTYIEGSWEQVMPVLRACHACARGASRHVITEIRIEDDEGQANKIRRNVESVESKAGHKLGRSA